MNDEQFQRLMEALFDIKAEIRDLRNDLRRRDEAVNGSIVDRSSRGTRR